MNNASKLVIVTGGGRGIGAAAVKRLREDGYDVLYTSRSADAVKTDCLQLELSDPSSIVAFEQALRSRGRRIYGLVNNAAANETCRLEETVLFAEVMQRVLAVNLSGTARLTSALLDLIDRPGRIVNISSQLGRIGREGLSAYCASKFGLNGLTEAWSRELAETGLTVNAVAPGWIATDMAKADLSKQAERIGEDAETLSKQIRSSLDQRRMNTPEEVAGIISFLLSEDSSGITGRVIEMAGPSR